ncbi:MAG: hypothetical protein ACYST0_04610 [Planctomycetota bacterium]
MITSPGDEAWTLDSAWGAVEGFLGSKYLTGAESYAWGQHPNIKSSVPDGQVALRVRVQQKFWVSESNRDNGTVTLTRYDAKSTFQAQPPGDSKEVRQLPGSRFFKCVSKGDDLFCAYHFAKPDSFSKEVVENFDALLARARVTFPFTVWARYMREQTWTFSLADIALVDVVRPLTTLQGHSNVFDITPKSQDGELCEVSAWADKAFLPWKQDALRDELFYKCKRFAHALMFLKEHYSRPR